ncbi:MAG: RHS repeat-associated core domain-containing protein [Ruminococcaceae bacterium]|nr:RHS repeat-associated core domain-containing protein [Oscillospiraceae bacterium]
MMKKTVKRFSFKSVTFFLAIIIAVLSLPLSVFAAGIASSAEPTDAEQELPEAFEIVELREESVKHYRLLDGTYVAAQYDVAVHEKDENGVWQDIDNSLSETLLGYQTNNERVKFAKKSTASKLIKIKDGEYQISYSLIDAEKSEAVVQTTSPEEEASVTKFEELSELSRLVSTVTYQNVFENTDIEYVLKGNAIKENIIVKAAGTDSYSYSFEIKLKNLEAALQGDGSIAFTDSETGKNVYSVPAPYMYDANGIVSHAVSYTLTQKGNKYILTVTADAAWLNAEGRALPVVIDPTLTYGPHNNGLESTYIDSANPNTNYVNTDPLQVGKTASGVSYALMRVPQLPTLPANAVLSEAKLYFSALYTSQTGANGKLTVAKISTSQLGSSWQANTVTYADCASGAVYLDSMSLDFWEFTSNTEHNGGTSQAIACYMDLTVLAGQWYDGTTPNHGVWLSLANASVGDTVAITNTNTSTKPYFTLTYRDTKGVEDYYTYASFPTDGAGTGYVNAFGGNLVFAHNSISTTDELLPYTLGLVYNSALAGKYYTAENAKTALTSATTGKGFKLSFDETVIKEVIAGTPYIILADADGTEHYFYNGSNAATMDDEIYMEYFDNYYRIRNDYVKHTLQTDIGLKVTFREVIEELVLSANEDLSEDFTLYILRGYEVEDDTGNFKQFSLDGRLTSITDANGNARYFNWHDEGYLQSISLTPYGVSAITQMTFTYTPAGKLATATNVQTGLTATFLYGTEGAEAGCLVGITYTYSSTDTYQVQFSYDTSGRLQRVTDTKTAISTVYTYDEADRVVQVQYYGENGAVGQTAGMIYEGNTTSYRTAGIDNVYGNDDDIITVYVLDRMGRVVTEYTKCGNKVYGATQYSYVSEDNDRAYHNYKTVTATGSATTNYLVNPGFDVRGSNALPANWSYSGITVSGTQIKPVSGENAVAVLGAYQGNAATLSQEYTCEAGTYTFAVSYLRKYLRAGDIAKIAVYRQSDNEVLVSSDNITNSIAEYPDEWERASVTFTLAESTAIYVQIELSSSAAQSNDPAQLYVDSAMLEKADGASSYSSIGDGSFESSSLLWDVPSYSEISESSNAFEGASALKITSPWQGTAEPAHTTLTYDVGVATSSSKPTSFVLSGWAKANATPKGKLELRAVLHYAGTDHTSTYTAEFNYQTTDWQFAFCVLFSEQIENSNANESVTYYCVTSIDIYCDYAGNLNTAYFDNISLVQNAGYLTEYTYNEKGYVTRSTCSDATGVELTYASNGVDVTKLTDIGANSYDITYDSKHRPTSFVNKNGDTDYTVSYEYDNVGHVTATYVEGSTVSATTYATAPGYFGAMLTHTDENGGTTRYFYNSKGELTGVADPNENGIVYTYNAYGQLTGAQVATYNAASDTLSVVPTGSDVGYSYNGKGQLLEIEANGTEYAFTYDAFGNVLSITANGQMLSANQYAPNNGVLLQPPMATAFSCIINMMSLAALWACATMARKQLPINMPITQTADRYAYRYGKQRQYEYTYDADGRLLLSAMRDNTGDTLYLRKLSYDGKGRVTAIDRYYPNSPDTAADTTTYTYTEEGNLATLTHSGAERSFTYLYDALGRYIGHNAASTTNSSAWQTVSIEYGGISNQVYGAYIDDTNNTVGEMFYYDEAGNIVEYYYVLYDGNYYQFNYTYDEKSQLVRADVLYSDDPTHESSATYVYTYDNAGNRTAVLKYAYTWFYETPMAPLATKSYTYQGNLLVSANGQAVTYDQIGNPLSYNGAAFTWQGRRLMQYAKGNQTVSYTYNADGIRTSKTVNGIKHEYVLDGTQILRERIYSANGQYVAEELRYYYDGQGQPAALRHVTFNQSGTETANDLYYFSTTLAGDVCHIYDENGTVLATYVYDAWGNVTEIQELADGGTEIANLNPLRYRGYYFDTDTGYYYLNSRYYSAEWGRFISADAYVSTGQGLTGCNMFIYCGNNPINFCDPKGEFFTAIAVGGIAAWKIGVAVVGLIIAAGVAASIAENPPAYPTIVSPKIEVKVQSESKVEDAVSSIPNETPKTTIIYRYGGSNPGNFVPSQKDVLTNSGLSFSTVPPPPGTRAVITTIEALNATGIVRAYQDKPGHVRVDPVVGTLADWRAGGSEHICTIAVKSVSVKWYGGK